MLFTFVKIGTDTAQLKISLKWGGRLSSRRVLRLWTNGPSSGVGGLHPRAHQFTILVLVMVESHNLTRSDACNAAGSLNLETR